MLKRSGIAYRRKVDVASDDRGKAVRGAAQGAAVLAALVVKEDLAPVAVAQAVVRAEPVVQVVYLVV